MAICSFLSHLLLNSSAGCRQAPTPTIPRHIKVLEKVQSAKFVLAFSQHLSPLSSLEGLYCLTLVFFLCLIILISLELLQVFPFPSPSLFRFLFQCLIPTCWHSLKFYYFPFPFSSQFTFSRSYFHASMATSLPVTYSFIFHTLIASSDLVVL